MSGFKGESMSEFLKNLLQQAEKHPWGLVGILIGFFTGLFMILIGFWETLFILLAAGVGFFIGKSKDDGIPLSGRVRKFRERLGLGKEE